MILYTLQENDNPRIDDVIEGQVSYTYNVWNQMIQSTTATHILTYTYNGEGRRVSKKANGETTQYVYEYDKVVLETDGNGKQTARNVYGTNLLSRTLSSDTVYYLYNAHGDVTSLMDSTGKLRSTFDYDAFGTPIDSAVRYYDQLGNITTGAGKIDSPIRYAGYQYDSESGLYYLNARYYDSKIARFLSEDTYRGRANDPLSLNLYTYAHNNPIQYYDPTGHTILKVGSSGEAVKKLQEELIKAGANIKADGSFGPATQKAVTDFQKAQGIKVDGTAGNQTINVLGAVNSTKGTSVASQAIASAKNSAPGAIPAGTIYASAETVNKVVKQAEELTKATGKVTITTVVNNTPVVVGSGANVVTQPNKTTNTVTTSTNTVTKSTSTVTNSTSTVTNSTSTVTKSTNTVTNSTNSVATSTGSKARFVEEIAGGNVSVEQALEAYKILTDNGGEITKKELNNIGIETSKGWLSNLFDSTAGNFEMVYQFSTQGLSVGEADFINTQNKIDTIINVAMVSVASIKLQGGGYKNTPTTKTSEGSGNVKYSPVNPGPLQDNIANTFRSSTYTKIVTQEEVTLYRAYGGKAGEVGSYWTRRKPQGPLQTTIDSALDQNWGNTATQVSSIRVPKGTTIFEGAAAEQRGLVGGGNQIFIEKVDSSWLIK